MMRSIEDLAAEEEARIQSLRRRWFRKASLWVLGLSTIAGWSLVAFGYLPAGSLIIVLSLAGLLFRSGSFRVHGFTPGRVIFSLMLGIFAFILYRATAAPSFLWGRDPSFWLASLGAMVMEPAWSPIGDLTVQALTVFIPADHLSLVFPVVCVFFAAVSVSTACFLYVFHATSDRTWKAGHWMLGVVVGLFLVVNKPFWTLATQASGLPAYLGFLFFALSQVPKGKEDPSAPSMPPFLLGLLFSAHPLWGVLGFVSLFKRKPSIRRFSFGSLSWVLAGLTPYAWILLRAGRDFPSWGGSHPFEELLRNGWDILWIRFVVEGDLVRSLQAWGFGIAWLVAFTLLRVVLFPKDRVPVELRLPMVLFFTAFVLGSFFYSSDPDCLSPVSLWVPILLVSAWTIHGNPHPVKRLVFPNAAPGFFHWRTAVLVSTVGLALLPGQRVARQDSDLPRRHALNLLANTDARTALFFDDPFEADACRVLQRIEGLASRVLVLDKGLLNRKWYLSGLIRYQPEWLFAVGNGSTDAILLDMVSHNLAQWDVRWAVSELPAPWDARLSEMGWKSYPQVLTQRFIESGPKEPPFEDPSSRFDLMGFLQPAAARDAATLKYLARYTRGFYGLGSQMEQLRNYSLAIRSYERAAKMDPAFNAPRESLARLYTEKQVLEAARMEFERILRGHPARIRLAMANAGKYGNDGKDPRIIGILDEIIRLNVELSDAQYHLGRIYEKEGKIREAQDLLVSAAQMAPQRLELQMELGFLMLKAGNRIKAAEAFRAALAVDPENKEAQRQLWRLLSRP